MPCNNIQLMHYFEVNIRICQPKNSVVLMRCANEIAFFKLLLSLNKLLIQNI